jgi:L-ascorbate metabolism protein UlaG (beta-lactamase superfamily)
MAMPRRVRSGTAGARRRCRRNHLRQWRSQSLHDTGQPTGMMRSFGAKPRGLRLERMMASPRWSGEGFRNAQPILPSLRDATVERPTLGDFLRGGPPRYPAEPLPSTDPRPAWQRKPSTGLRATWLGHSTVLVEIDGVRVLTDPVWGERASPFALIGPRRFQRVPIRLRELPPVDAVLISHDHYDHLDYPTIRALARYSAVPIVTSLGVGAHLEAWGIAPARITELDWWQSHRLPGTDVVVTAAPSQHFSGRSLGDRNTTLWSSLAIRSPHHAVFFSGDTGLTRQYADIRERLGPFDLVMLEIGAWHPAWGDVHLGPVNALEAHTWLGGGALMPIHWGTFALAMHAWDEPAETLLSLGRARGTPLVLPMLGEAVEPSIAAPPRAWWRGAASRAASAEPDAPSPVETSLRAHEIPWPID